MGESQLIKFIKKGKYEKQLSIVRNTYGFFHRRKFGRLGKGSYIWNPTFLSGMKHFFFGDKVGFWPGARIEAIDEWGGTISRPDLSLAVM